MYRALSSLTLAAPQTYFTTKTTVVRSLNSGRDEQVPKLSHFVDSLRVRFVGGNGGDGCISFLQEFAREFGGPDGGNGGNGGHVILKACRHIKSLNNVSSQYRGVRGGPGLGKNKFGKAAYHEYVQVPIGTTVKHAKPKDINDLDYDPDASEIIADLDEDGSMFVAARGGAGGNGNNAYLSNKNRHPKMAQLGGKGESNVYELNMRIYADFGLIGLPNAGKSTLLRTLTNANVVIGEYAFTTLYPQVGTLEYDDYSQVAIADLPGLIQDSHKNRGLGIQFLRHVERCACLIYVVDMSAEEPVAQLEQLQRELDIYKKGLRLKPRLIVGNKIDLDIAAKNVAEVKEYLSATNTPFLPVSAKEGHNLEYLRLEFKRLYDEYIIRYR